ncbi:L-threonylcarbamoyladenylate synthase [Thermodesulfobacteriota bacterium]
MKINKEEQEPAISRAREILSSGGIVAFPTESFYGLGVDAANEEAVKQIFKLKLRPMNQPLLLLISSADMLDNYVEEIPDVADKLIEQFWPGGLTIVFKASKSLSPMLTASTGKIGIRLSSHPVANALAESLGKPVTGTSANISGQPACSTAQEVFKALGDKVDLILDGGTTKGGKGSTILDVTVDPPLIIREGMISTAMIDRAIF